MCLRIMGEADIPAGMRLKEISGWNQTAEDWGRFLNASPNGCFVAEVDSRVVGTAATICYEDKFAWIGMVLVDPVYRGRGIGTRLLEKTIAFLDEVKIPTMKLDATPLGKPLYEKIGFVTEYEIERLILKRGPEQLSNTQPTDAQRPISNSELEIVMARDSELFGADRIIQRRPARIPRDLQLAFLCLAGKTSDDPPAVRGTHIDIDVLNHQPKGLKIHFLDLPG